MWQHLTQKVSEGLLEPEEAASTAAVLGNVVAGLAAARNGPLLADLAQAYVDAMATGNSATTAAVEELENLALSAILEWAFRELC